MKTINNDTSQEFEAVKFAGFSCGFGSYNEVIAAGFTAVTVSVNGATWSTVPTAVFDGGEITTQRLMCNFIYVMHLLRQAGIVNKLTGNGE
jgi:hypothetical protein